ncbi:MAG: hypothetical protein JXL85_02085 [Bacilli bacterium]|nr:hypothetical protein [Bacilli bacterium]
MTTKKKFMVLLTMISIVLILIVLSLFMPYGILLNPLITPAEYLSLKPNITVFHSLIIIVPSSTLIVYGLGILIIAIGCRLISKKQMTWGLSLLFWGVGTILAGTSYQGLGYELKCEGFEYCVFTSWFELSYLFFTAISITLMAIAFSRSILRPEYQKWMIYPVSIALVVYTTLLIVGSVTETYFLITYELFTIFFMPVFVVLFIINIFQFKKHRDALNRSFISLWLLFLLVNILYYVYYLPDITGILFRQTGIWFSANDVLHIGLIIWFVYFERRICPKLTNEGSPIE